jgi:tryptophan synthase beta chain
MPMKIADHRRYGDYGGRYVPETLVPALERLASAVEDAFADEGFLTDFRHELRDFVGRPTPLTPAPRLGELWGGKVWFKREDLCHTGAHKINNAIGQVLLAKKLGAARVVAETGAGQHGVASAAACARLAMPCVVYMGAIDVERQAPNVERMKLFGAEVIAVESGDRTLRAAIDEALRDWVSDPEQTYYLLGSAVGPFPYPALVRELQSVIGTEARAQSLEFAGGLPDEVVACVGGGSNAIGVFSGFLDDDVALLGIEAGGDELRHGASLSRGRPGVLHGAYSYLLQTDEGQVSDTHSISAGLDYPGVGPEHSMLRDSGRVRYESVTDAEALTALDECCRLEGILPALETAHAIAGARRSLENNPGRRLLINCSGRGDKDLGILLGQKGGAGHGEF